MLTLTRGVLQAPGGKALPQGVLLAGPLTQARSSPGSNVVGFLEVLGDAPTAFWALWSTRLPDKYT